jgi:hypothetical protein
MEKGCTEGGYILRMKKRLDDEFMRFCGRHNIDGEKLIYDKELQEEWSEIQSSMLFHF